MPYVVLAEHQSVPGIVVNVHETHAGAVAEAAELVAIMWKDAGWSAWAPYDWEKRLERLQDEYGAAHCYTSKFTTLRAIAGGKTIFHRNALARAAKAKAARNAHEKEAR